MENIAKVRINGESCMALLDNGVQVNTITPKYVKEHSLPVGPITDLMGSKVACVGLGNAYTRPLGYVIIQVQVDRVQGYDEDQIALIILDSSNFAMRVPIILGTPTIGRVVNVMREVEMDTLAMPWANARAAHLLAIRRMTPVEVVGDQEEGCKTDQDSPLMYTQKVEMLEPFSSHVIPMRMMEAYLGECFNIMVQALHAQDGTFITWHYHAEYVHRTEKGQQEGGSGGAEQHCLSPDSLEEDSCSKGNGRATGTRYPQAWESTSSR